VNITTCFKISQIEETGKTIKVESGIEQSEATVMKHTTLFPDGSRDLIIGLTALALTVMIWSVLIVSIAV